jgi:hypothetical protein
MGHNFPTIKPMVVEPLDLVVGGFLPLADPALAFRVHDGIRRSGEELIRFLETHSSHLFSSEFVLHSTRSHH